MNISHNQSSNVIFEDLGPAKLKRRSILPPLPSLPPLKNPLIGIPIAQRLVFGFLIPALIAALAAGIIGIQSAQLLNQESGFYQNLFQDYSSPISFANFCRSSLKMYCLLELLPLRSA